MCIDNDGEGGILALMSLLGVNKQQRLLIIAFGLFGAALIYGDGAVTPAISVLSAVEGLHMATPVLEPYILPSATAILVRYLRSSLWGHTILVRLSVPSCSSPVTAQTRQVEGLHDRLGRCDLLCWSRNSCIVTIIGVCRIGKKRSLKLWNAMQLT
jgi:hypothetical protein